MNREEFERLRDLPDKRIIGNIEFTPSRQVSTTLIIDRIRVENSAGYEIVLNGSYIRDIPSLKLNFHIVGTGAFCRLEINGKVHKNAGRTHKHSVHDESSIRRHLPDPTPRADLDLTAQSAKQIWETLCQEANITHLGEFVDPE